MKSICLPASVRSKVLSVLWQVVQVPVPPLPTERSVLSMMEYARSYATEVVESNVHTLDLLKVLNTHRTDDVKFAAEQLAAEATEAVTKAEQWLAERSWWPRTGPKPAPTESYSDACGECGSTQDSKCAGECPANK